MILELGQGDKVSPQNYTPDSIYTTGFLLKIYGVEKIS
jgi:hypothetical protein